MIRPRAGRGGSTIDLGMEQARTSKQRLLQRAAQLVGQERLAARLGISKSLLQGWMRGDVTMPDRKLLALAAVLDDLAGTKEE